MSNTRDEDGDGPRRRKVTASIPEELHNKLNVAKMYSGKPLYVLIEEGLELVVSYYRALRKAERRNDSQGE